MTQHFLRLKWMPSDENELQAAFNDGLLAEKNWCDLKRELGSGKGANPELARDLASFAVDGGTLIIGLDEKCAAGSPLTPVDLSAVTPERIEQVAAMKVDPPLTVECSVIKAPSKPGAGYVLVHVPESPLAPHQVEGRYMGRGDKAKRYLSDAEVAAHMQRRQQAIDIADKILADFANDDPFAVIERRRAHLYLIAHPVRHDAQMLRPLVEDPGRVSIVVGLLSEILATPWIQALRLDAMPFKLTPQLLYEGARTADGFKLDRDDDLDPDPEIRERWAASLELCEDGGLRYFDSSVSSGSEWHDRVRRTVLYVDLISGTCRVFLALASKLSDRFGFAGTWQLGVGVSGLKGAQGQQVSGPFQPWKPDTYTKENYRLITGATAREIHDYPGRVTERLLGRLHRSLADGIPAAFIDREDGPASQ